MKKLSIIIPVFNEQDTIFDVLSIVHAIKLVSNVEKEIIVVNDCSTDNSHLEISRFSREFPEVTVVNQPTIKGKEERYIQELNTPQETISSFRMPI